MYVSILEYRLHDVDDAGWQHSCEELAHALADVPGLLTKIWLHGGGDQRGGVYVWLDKGAFERFLASDLAAKLGSHPNVRDLTVKEYAVDEALTKTTRGMALGAAWAAQYTR